MKFSPLAAFAAVFLAALCAFAPGAASAQGRDNVYVVGGVRVDETAANAAAAQQAGFAAAQRAGFDRLDRRLTIPDELSTRGVPQVEMGGHNAMKLFNKMPQIFDRLALLCPAQLDFSPFGEWGSFSDHMSDIDSVLPMLMAAVGLMASYYE